MKEVLKACMAFLVLIVAFSGWARAQDVKPLCGTGDSCQAAQQKAETPAARKTVAFYFHGTARCRTCIKLESYSAAAVQKSFSEDLKSGKLEWRVVNVDEAENGHFITDFKLYTKSVVLVEMDGDKTARWKNLDKIWSLVGDEAAFSAYVTAELKNFMAGS